MKTDNNYCILSVKYSITQKGKSTEKEARPTEMEHVFIGRNKESLMRKIEAFEKNLHNRQDPKKPLIHEWTDRFMNFCHSYRRTYQNLIRM